MHKKLWLPFLAALLLLTACGKQAATPALDPAGTFTAVARTLSAQQPTATLEVTGSPTPTPPATATLIPTVQMAIATRTVYSDSYSVSSSSCDDASYVSDVTIADGTEIYPGESFDKTWKIYNAGTCTWSTEDALTYVSGKQMGGADTYLQDSVAPGETISITVSMVAPETEGTYTGYWRMQNDSGTLFGDTIYVNIVVTNDAATSTPTPTLTSTTTATTTSSPSTPAPTSTTVLGTTTIPTLAPTATVVPTAITAPTATTAPTTPFIPATDAPVIVEDTAASDS